MAGDGADSEFVDFLRDQLQRWATVTGRRMFGGHGLYRGRVMFGLISGDTLYFRTDEANARDFTEAGMPPFRYERAGRMVALGYHQVPAEVMEDAEYLALWAERAYGAALRRAAAPRPPRRKRRPARAAARPAISE